MDPTPNNPKNQNFENIKQTSKDIMTLHMSTKNDNPMMYGYGSWDSECDRQNFLSFWTIFCPYTPLTTQKIKILRKWKKKNPGDIIILHKCTIMTIIWCMVPEIWNVTDRTFCHFGSLFALLPPPHPPPPPPPTNDKILKHYISFWAVFFPFTSLTARKIKI